MSQSTHDRVVGEAKLSLIQQLFSARAARLRRTSYGILGVIFLLLVGGAIVFVFAPQLSQSDLLTEVDSKMVELSSEYSRVVARATAGQAIESEGRRASEIASTAWMMEFISTINKYANPQVTTPRTPDMSVSPEQFKHIPEVSREFVRFDHHDTDLVLGMESDKARVYYVIPAASVKLSQSEVQANLATLPAIPPHRRYDLCPHRRFGCGRSE